MVYIYKTADKEWSVGTASNLSFKTNTAFTVGLFANNSGEYDTAIIVKP